MSDGLVLSEVFSFLSDLGGLAPPGALERPRGRAGKELNSRFQNRDRKRPTVSCTKTCRYESLSVSALADLISTEVGARAEAGRGSWVLDCCRLFPI